MFVFWCLLDPQKINLLVNMAPACFDFGSQDGPKLDPKWDHNRSKNGLRSELGFRTDFGSMVGRFGVDFWSILGRFWDGFWLIFGLFLIDVPLDSILCSLACLLAWLLASLLLDPSGPMLGRHLHERGEAMPGSAASGRRPGKYGKLNEKH